MYGFIYDIGDADYWPNGGYCNQPGCEKDITGKFLLKKLNNDYSLCKKIKYSSISSFLRKSY